MENGTTNAYLRGNCLTTTRLHTLIMVRDHPPKSPSNTECHGRESTSGATHSGPPLHGQLNQGGIYHPVETLGKHM